MGENTAIKYVQFLKEVMDRAVSKKWLISNVFAQFKCRYTDPHHDWLTMEELDKLHKHHFEKEKLNRIRDIFLFSSFTGYSFQEIYSMKPSDFITGINGKKWNSMKRQKTEGDATVPLLPCRYKLLKSIERIHTAPTGITYYQYLPTRNIIAALKTSQQLPE